MQNSVNSKEIYLVSLLVFRIKRDLPVQVHKPRIFPVAGVFRVAKHHAGWYLQPQIRNSHQEWVKLWVMHFSLAWTWHQDSFRQLCWQPGWCTFKLLPYPVWRYATNAKNSSLFLRSWRQTTSIQFVSPSRDFGLCASLCPLQGSILAAAGGWCLSNHNCCKPESVLTTTSVLGPKFPLVRNYFVSLLRGFSTISEHKSSKYWCSSEGENSCLFLWRIASNWDFPTLG